MRIVASDRGQVTGCIINRSYPPPTHPTPSTPRQREPISFENQTLPAETNWGWRSEWKDGDEEGVLGLWLFTSSYNKTHTVKQHQQINSKCTRHNGNIKKTTTQHFLHKHQRCYAELKHYKAHTTIDWSTKHRAREWKRKKNIAPATTLAQKSRYFTDTGPPAPPRYRLSTFPNTPVEMLCRELK